MARPLQCAALAAVVAGCTVNPATGRKEFNIVSESQEIALGMQEAQRTATQIGSYQDSAWQGYVSALGKRLAAQSERPQLPWTFTVVDDPQVNAFALPGGFIFVTRGILTHMGSEAELAGVLGHEIGHVTARHSATQMSRAQMAQLGLGLGTVLRPDLAQYAGVVSTGLGLLFLKYSRDDEREADKLGFRYSIKGGYDPHAMLDLFAMLQSVDSSSGRERLPAWATTHPFPENRYTQTQRMLDSAKVDYAALALDQDDYLRRLDGMVYGDDPRQGYFDGQAFYHPELRFQVTFPQGWKAVNGFSAVTGLTEAQDGMLQLGLGSADSLAAQLRTFLQQEGVTTTSTSRASVNGLPAASARFTVGLEQGLYYGTVTYLGHGGRNYRLLGLAAADKSQSYDPLIRAWIQSFRPLTDPARLNVRPDRIRIVKLPRPMTLTAFNTRYPSTIPLAEVALLNGVATDATLPAGTLVKQVAP